MAVGESQDIWAHFNWLDWSIIFVIGASLMISLARGFIREVISLVTWVAAVWVSFHYTADLAVVLEAYIDSQVVRMLVSIAMLFFATLIVGVLVNVMVGGLLMRSRLSFADRMLGLVFGATRGLLLVTLMTMVGGLTMLPQSDWWMNASLVPYFERSATWLATFLPEKVVHFVGNDKIISEDQVRMALSPKQVGDQVAAAASGVVDKHKDLSADDKSASSGS
jgi:membrane protein required for colicin V production